MATGAELLQPPPAVCEKVAAQGDQMFFEDDDLARVAGALRLLDRLDPSYKS